MNKKLAVSVIGIVLSGSAVFVFNSPVNPTVPSSAQNVASEAPDYIVYRHLFRHAAALNAKADELVRQNKDAAHLRGFFKRKADLTDGQAQILNQIASRFALELGAIDERAKPFIEAYKAQYPNGRVPHGQTPAPPPAELREMTKEKNQLVLRKRNELREAFGETEFKRFEEFVKNKIAPNVTPSDAAGQ